jgi:hypothetical protein
MIICRTGDRLVVLVFRVPGNRCRGHGFHPGHYQIFLELVGREGSLLSIMRTIEDLLGRNSNGSVIESPEYGHWNPLRWPRCTLYPKNLALRSPTSCGRSVGMVCCRTKSTDYDELDMAEYRCFKKSFTKLKAYINVLRGLVQSFEL